MGQASRQRRYTAEFKRDAVALLNSSGRSIAAVARELGVNETSLGTWARANQKSGDVKIRKHQSDAEREEELRQRGTPAVVIRDIGGPLGRCDPGATEG